jgi:hypothetical protein
MFDVTPFLSSKSKVPADLTDLELAQALVERNIIAHQNWHRLKGDRQAQAKQQLTSALVFLLKNQPQEALEHINQAAGWLDGSLKSPPCPDAQRKNK